MRSGEDYFKKLPKAERLFDNEEDCDAFLSELEEQNRLIARESVLRGARIENTTG